MVINDVSINVRAGEVVGIAGLMGAGRTEFAMSVFGRSWGHFVERPGAQGRQGDRRQHDPQGRRRTGSRTSTEDRKTYGLVLMNDVKTNITLANLAGRVERRAS